MMRWHMSSTQCVVEKRGAGVKRCNTW